MRSGAFCGGLTALVVFFGCTGAVSGGVGSIASVPDKTWVTDGPVFAIARLGDTVYLGGRFNQIGPRTGPGVGLDVTTGQADPGLPEVAGASGSGAAVWVVVPDGVGGWFVGGSFRTIGGLPRRNIAHIRADKSVDPNFDPDPNRQVEALTLVGTTLYVGGIFTSIGGQARNRIAALDSTNGQATSWNPNVTGSCEPSSCYVDALAVSGPTVYVGGYFGSIGGQNRANIAAVDSESGQATEWNPSADSDVVSLAISESAVYAAGEFTSIGGEARNRLAALTLDDGHATGWNPNATGTCEPYCNVRALALSGSTLYAGGYFDSIGGSPRRNAAAFDTGTGQVKAWNPNPTGTCELGCAILSIGVLGSTVYLGGDFLSIGGEARNYIAALDADTAQATPWNPSANRWVYALGLSPSTIYAGGYFMSVGGLARRNAAAFNAGTGHATSWNPHANFEVLALAAAGSTIYAGGAFNSIGGADRNRVAALDPITGDAKPWNPDANNFVYTLAVSGSTVYAGGRFTSIGGAERNHIAALNAIGEATAWDPHATGTDAFIKALTVSGSIVYVGGLFDSIGGQLRNRIAAIDVATGQATPWNPNANDWITTLAVSGQNVYVGGHFTSVGGEDRNWIAALDANSGHATSWNPNASGPCQQDCVSQIVASASDVYVGGSFTSIGGAPRRYLAALDAVTAQATAWDPYPTAPVLSVANSGPTVYVGGHFSGMGQSAQQGFASFSEVPSSTAPPLITGIAEPGHLLTTSDGAWSGSLPMSYSYAWLRDGVPIAGETGSTYLIQEGDLQHELSSRVTARNLGGSSSATSGSVHVGALPPPPPPQPPPQPPPPPPAPPPPPSPPVRCVVPRVVGLTLSRAKRLIRARRCSVGRVKRARSRRVGRVLSQTPRAGTRLARGGRVSLVVGRR